MGDDDTKNKDPVVKVLQEAINAIPTSEMLIQAFRFAEDYRNEILSLSSNDASASAAEEEVNGFIRNVWTKAEGMDSSDLVMEQTHYLLSNNNKNNVEEAVKIIKAYCTKSRNGNGSGDSAPVPAPCDAWILWTSLVTP